MSDLIKKDSAIKGYDTVLSILDSAVHAVSEAKAIVLQYGSEQPEQRWIPCSERLPEDDVEVFVYLFDGQSPYIAWVCDCHWYTEDFEVEKENYPTAWMPLPECYKGE